MWCRFYYLLTALQFGLALGDAQNQFPSHFKFGAATAAHQIEGAWNEDGKSESNWDHLTHIPNFVDDGSTADIAADSYHKYKEDVALLKDLGVASYRFSLSWSRILPTGFSNTINPLGIAYYNNLIDELLANNIAPMVTIHHWDMPWSLQQLGGWTNPALVEYFGDFARVVFKNFGDRVKLWLTINEPYVLCSMGYGGDWAPALNASGVADYLCGHNVLKAHAKAYHIYHKEFRAKQSGRIGITLDEFWFDPASENLEDVAAAERKRQFTLGWFANPIFSKSGDYPEVMRTHVEKASRAQGFARSRLPAFTPEEITLVKGSSDFLGLNYYTSSLSAATQDFDATPSSTNDALVRAFQDQKWPGSDAPWLKNTPWALRKLLRYIKDNYNNPEIIITENGFADKGELCDVGRYNYYQNHLQVILEAIHVDKVNLTGFHAWSLIDDFEWKQGYTIRFGLYHVDFSSPERTRTPKYSVDLFKRVIKERALVRREVNDSMCPEWQKRTTTAGADKKLSSIRILVITSIILLANGNDMLLW